MPYLTFLELYKFQIINIIQKADGINYNEALGIFNRAAMQFDDWVYLIMKEMVVKTKGGMMILLNRNPTINHGSIMLLRISDVKKAYNDVTISISNNILAPLGGDYDGDTLNIIPLMDNKFKRTFALFNPKNMMISNDDFRFNQAMGLDKDLLLGVSSLLR